MKYRNAERKAKDDARELGHDMLWLAPRYEPGAYFVLAGACRRCQLSAYIVVTPHTTQRRGPALIVECDA